MRSLTPLVMALLFPLLFAACSPAAVPVEAQPLPTEPLPSATIAPTLAEETAPATSTPEPELVYPYYLPLTTRPDIPPQTINGVTAQIDWAYMDESRISVHYTISGLDWPQGTLWDAMGARVTSPSIPDKVFSGAGGWNSTPVDQGEMTGTIDQLFWDGRVDADQTPTVKVRVDLPVEGPTSVGTFHFAFDLPVLDAIRMEHLDQTIHANDVAMTLKTLTLSPSWAEALICFEMPSAVDWGLTASQISLGGREFRFTGGGLANGVDGKSFGLTDPERCNSVGFDLFDDGSASSVTLTVPRLMGSLPEVISKEQVEIANQRLAERGIEFDYANVDHGGNIEILKQPAGMTQMEIYPLIWEALAEQYEGPWVFTIPIER